jgi:hypothetical protein
MDTAGKMILAVASVLLPATKFKRRFGDLFVVSRKYLSAFRPRDYKKFLMHGLKAYKRSGVIAPPILNLGTR